MKGGSLDTIEPIPTPLAPAARAKGAVTSVRPDEHIIGIVTARESAYEEAIVGVAISNNSWTPKLVE